MVSNLWSDKRAWHDLFERHGLLERFDVLVFSSDGPYVKPSSALFQLALSAISVAPGRILFIGDDPYRDIAGAKALGMATLLVGDEKAKDIVPDWRLPSLLELLRPDEP